MSCHSGPSDVLGRRLRVGDRVRVVGAPPLAGLSETGKTEFAAAFKKLKERPRTIREFDARGNAELWVRIAGKIHILMLEPGLLEWTR